MELLSTSDQNIKRAAEALKAGLLVAFPTETVYGLGGDAFNPHALAKIFEAKNRPRFDPLIIHIAELSTVSRIADLSLLSEAAKKKLDSLSRQLWPGPLTLILPKRKEVPDLATSGLVTAAIRFPSNEVAQKLIAISTGALAAPSANLFGCLSPIRAEHVINQLGEKVDYIIDGGKTLIGVESTVLDLTSDMPRILRPGGTSRETIEDLIGPVDYSPAGNEESPQGETPASPGLLKSHYAPRTPLVLYQTEELAAIPVAPNEGRLYFSDHLRCKGKTAGRGFPSGPTVKVLSETGTLIEAAANLFDMLHELDSLGLKLIRAEEAPNTGLGLAINDRLRRAAHA